MYVHLPKCAGTTLIKSFARLGRARHLIVSRSPDSKAQALADLKALMEERLVDSRELAAVSGHDVFIGLHEVSEREPVYATILREPVARYISHYRFFVDCALDEEHIIHDYAKGLMIENGQPISLEEFTDRKMVTNTMATYLAAANHPDRQSSRTTLKHNDEIIELASGCLRRMDFIGLVEKFPEDLERLCSIAGIQAAPAANKSVHAVPSETIDDELMEKILDNNRLDIEIYRLATQLREEKLAQLGMDTSDATYVTRVSRNGGIEASDIRRLNALESEVDRLKEMYAAMCREVEQLRNAAEK